MDVSSLKLRNLLAISKKRKLALQQSAADKESSADEEPRIQKPDALECSKKEKEAQIMIDNLKLRSLRNLNNALTANQKVKTLEDKNKMLQEQNIELENQLKRAKNANKNLEKEKDMILKYNITLEKLCRIYEAQIADNDDSGDDAVEQKETGEEN